MLMLSMRGSTTWDPLVNVLLAKHINQALGGPFVSPWEVDQLDEASINVITSTIRNLPPMREGLMEIERVKDRIRNAHPTFSKRRGRIH